MSDHRCDATNVNGLRCERLDGHAGAHMHGLEPGSNLRTAWGWAAPGGNR